MSSARDSYYLFAYTNSNNVGNTVWAMTKLVRLRVCLHRNDVYFAFRHCQLPYTEESGVSLDVLTNLRANTEVEALRNIYGADLVQLVTTLDGSCGIGWVT